MAAIGIPPDGGPTWTYSSYPTAQWNLAGAGKLGAMATRRPTTTARMIAARVDGTFVMQAVNEEVTFSGANITQAFRFWFDNPPLITVTRCVSRTMATQEVKFERWKRG